MTEESKACPCCGKTAPVQIRVKATKVCRGCGLIHAYNEFFHDADVSEGANIAETLAQAEKYKRRAELYKAALKDKTQLYRDVMGFSKIYYKGVMARADQARAERDRAIAERDQQARQYADLRERFTKREEQHRLALRPEPLPVCNPATCSSKTIAEAGTVATETGKTPRQLADENAELVAALEKVLGFIDSGIDMASGGFDLPPEPRTPYDREACEVCGWLTTLITKAKAEGGQ